MRGFNIGVVKHPLCNRTIPERLIVMWILTRFSSVYYRESALLVVGLPDCVDDGSVRTGCLLLLSAGYIVVSAFSFVRNSDSSVGNTSRIETPRFVDQARKGIGLGRISLLSLLSLLGTLLLYAGIIVLLLTRSTEEEELLLLLFGGDGDVSDAKDESSVSARVEGNERFRKIPRKIEMGELDRDDCGAGILFSAEVVIMDCCVMVVDGTVKNLVLVETSLDGRFDDNMLERMVVDDTVKNLV